MERQEQDDVEGLTWTTFAQAYIILREATKQEEQRRADRLTVTVRKIEKVKQSIMRSITFNSSLKIDLVQTDLHGLVNISIGGGEPLQVDFALEGEEFVHIPFFVGVTSYPMLFGQDELLFNLIGKHVGRPLTETEREHIHAWFDKLYRAFDLFLTNDLPENPLVVTT